MRRIIALPLALAAATAIVTVAVVLTTTAVPRDSSEPVTGVAPITVEKVAPEPPSTPTPAPSGSAAPAPAPTVEPVAPEAPHDVGDDRGGHGSDD